VAQGNSHVVARENSHIEARGNSHIEAQGNSHVVARENSHIEAWGNSHIEAWGNSHVVARENSHIEAWENSHVVARENSHIEAWENSHVEAWGNSHIEAWGNVAVWGYSDNATILLYVFAVCWKLAKAKITKKSKTSTIITSKQKPGMAGWLETNAVKDAKTIIVYKRVSKNFYTQEDNKRNKTLWKVGTTLTHPAWKPKGNECGEDKYHACSRAYFCDEFRSNHDDRYVAIQVAKKDCYAWDKPQYPYKIAFRKGTVLYECDRYGKKI